MRQLWLVLAFLLASCLTTEAATASTITTVSPVVTNLNGGINASFRTYLRGDGIWATPPGTYYVQVSSNQALAVNSYYAVDTNAARSFTLPPLAGMSAGSYIVTADLNGLAATNPYVVTASGSDQINGASTNPVTVQASGPITFVVGAGGTSWYVLVSAGGGGSGGSGTTICGSSGQILYNNAGACGGLSVTGSGSVVAASAPTITSPTFGTGVTLSYLTGLTQCVTVNSAGVLSGTGSACGSGGGAVSSVFGRTGAVVAATGDYTAAQVTGAATSGANSNITSLSGLTTPLSQPQGGTGTTTATGSGSLVLATAPTISAPTFSGTTTLSSLTGSTQCLNVNSSGVVSGTGAACGSGGGGSPGGSVNQLQANNGSGGFAGLTPAQALNRLWNGLLIDPMDPAYGSNTCTGYYTIAASTLGSGGGSYAVGDTFTVNSTMNGGVVANPAVGTVTSVSGGVVTGYTLLHGGGYSTASGQATTRLTGSGSGLTINITSIGTGNDDTTAIQNAIAVAAPVGAGVLMHNGCWVQSLPLINGANLIGPSMAVNYGYDYNPTTRLFIIGHPTNGINTNGAASVSFSGFEVNATYDNSAFGTTNCVGSTNGNSGYPQGKVWFLNFSAKGCNYGFKPTAGSQPYVLAVSINSDWGANNNGLGGALSDLLVDKDTYVSITTHAIDFTGGNGGFTRITNSRFEYNGVDLYGPTYQLLFSGNQSDHTSGCSLQLTNFGQVNATGNAFRGAGQNGSFVVTGAANNGSGLIRLTLSGNNSTVTSGIVTGDKITVAGVVGVTAANGNWTTTVIDGTHIDLQSSTFSGSYTSGGFAGVWGKDAVVCLNASSASAGVHLTNNQYSNAIAVGGTSSPAFILDDQSANADYIEIAGGFGDPTYGAPSYSIAPANFETYGAPAHARIDLLGAPRLNNDTVAPMDPTIAFGSLPTCNAALASSHFYVTGTATPSYNATITSGSSSGEGLCNGSNWVFH